MNWFTKGMKRISGWYIRLPLAAKIILPSALVIVVLGGSYGGARAYNYIENDPGFCRSCHLMETAWTKWETSEHSKVGCHSCHSVSPVGGASMVFYYLIKRPDRIVGHATVTDKSCEKCHYGGNPQWAQVASTAGHKVHAEEQNLACQKCHGLRLHIFKPAIEICAACHADHVSGQELAIKTVAMRDMHCIECHPFLRADSPLRPTRDTCLGCHQSLQSDTVVFPDVAPMKWECSKCHKPHNAANPVVDCRGCHTDLTAEGRHTKETLAEFPCTTCHTPHLWTLKNGDT